MTIVATRTIKTCYILGGGLLLSGLALNLFLIPAISKPLAVNGWIVAGCGDALILLGFVSLIIGKIKDRQLQKKIETLEKAPLREKAALKIQRWFRKPLNQAALSQNYYYKHPSTKKPKLRKFTIIEANTSEQREKIKKILTQNESMEIPNDDLMREAEILHKAKVISDEDFGSIKSACKKDIEDVFFLFGYLQKQRKTANCASLIQQIFKYLNLIAIKRISRTYCREWSGCSNDIMKYASDEMGQIHSVIIIDRVLPHIYLLLSSPTNIDKTNEMRVDGAPTALLVSAAMDQLRWARTNKKRDEPPLLDLEPSTIGASYYEHLGFKMRFGGPSGRIMYLEGYGGLRNFILRHGGRAQVALS